MTFVVILVIAAVVTPTPDPVSQLAMAIPMYLLFEIAILIIKRMRIGEETEE
jgi:sec-independent protein translocase protein TatC